MACAICNQVKKGDVFTVRQSWLDAGGFGSVPPDARVHPKCDAKEQRAIERGKIKLSDLWQRTARK